MTGAEPDNQNTLVIEDPQIRDGFTQIPNIILRTRNLSRDAKLLYGVLLSYAWQKGSCFPGYDTLQEDMQCGRPQVSKYLKELKEMDLIHVKRRGQGKTSIYTIKALTDQKRDELLGIEKNGADTQKFQNETTRSSGSEPQEVSERNGEEYPDEEDSSEEDSSNIRMTITNYVEDFAREFRDQAPLKSSVTRAVNLFDTSGMSWDDFRQAMYTAREKTKFATKVKNRTAYWFTCLEQLVKEQK